MSATIADIARNAFDAIAGTLADVVRPCVLTRLENCEFSPSTGMVECDEVTTAGRVVFDVTRPTEDMWPNLAPGPQDLLCWLQGLDWPPQEDDTLTIGADAYTVMQVADVALSSGGYAGAVVRRS